MKREGTLERSKDLGWRRVGKWKTLEIQETDGDECQRPPGMLETGTCKQWHSRSQHNILPNHPRQRGLEGKVGPPECGTGLREREYENRAGQGLCSSWYQTKLCIQVPCRQVFVCLLFYT